MLIESMVSIANTMSDDPFTDADRLKALIDALPVKQAQFAKTANVPGGASLLSQHKSGHRPISMDSVIAYARGLQVPIDAISPSLAATLREAATLLSPQGKRSAQSHVSLSQALQVLGIELARDMPNDVREDAADILGKLALRRGAERHQHELITLLEAPHSKRTGTGG